MYVNLRLDDAEIEKSMERIRSLMDEAQQEFMSCLLYTSEGAGVLEGIGDNALVDLASARQSGHFHDQHRVPKTSFQVVQKCLHLWTGSDGFTGYDFGVDFADSDVQPIGKR